MWNQSLPLCQFAQHLVLVNFLLVESSRFSVNKDCLCLLFIARTVFTYVPKISVENGSKENLFLKLKCFSSKK
jgi:hypothetical protein